MLVYGLLLVALGYVGYTHGSKVSLYMGSGLGGLLILCSLVMFWGKRWGGWTALVLTAILTAVFSYRYSVVGKTIPALLAVLSGAMLLILLLRLPKWKR